MCLLLLFDGVVYGLLVVVVVCIRCRFLLFDGILCLLLLFVACCRSC